VDEIPRFFVSSPINKRSSIFVPTFFRSFEGNKTHRQSKTESLSRHTKDHQLVAGFIKTNFTSALFIAKELESDDDSLSDRRQAFTFSDNHKQPERSSLTMYTRNNCIFTLKIKLSPFCVTQNELKPRRKHHFTHPWVTETSKPAAESTNQADCSEDKRAVT
jgi:hypothetical protein